jgi:hypothetical protein
LSGVLLTKRVILTKEQLTELYINQKLTAIIIAKMFGVHNTTITRKLAKLGIPVTSIRDVRKGIKCSEETKQKISRAMQGHKRWLGKHHTTQSKIKLRNYHLGSVISEIVKQKMSQTHKTKFEDESYKNRILDSMASGTKSSPNSKELIVMDILNQIQPNEWEFVGNKKLKIGGRNPDFINRNRNLLCEHFGVYWHGVKARNDLEREEGRINHFRRYGYDTLVIWENELKIKNRSTLLDKVMSFCYQPIDSELILCFTK